MAIAEWPTESGPADYVLFCGLTPMAPVEAKRKNVDVSASLVQAKRYSRGFKPSPETEIHENNWGAKQEFRLPFVFSANGRPYLRQLATRSGIWFCDVRRPENLSEALQGWFTPEGLIALLKSDKDAAHELLASEGFDYDFGLRFYQKNSILATEDGIIRGLRELLIAMATGTGKTKTCIALIYRLLKTKRFRRILFLVDRSALGEQAANAFKETRMENLNTFAEIFGIKEIDEQKPDTATAVHIATIQGMVQRVLYPSENNPPPAVDQYDCIFVDECHRGYLLDREMSETEQSFRSFEDYVSKYRRVIDYFSAVKIGLTATPALHTSEIFGPPIFTYGYREAVIDGFLIDHDSPFKISTELSESGIVWQQGEAIELFKPDTSEIELAQAPDEIRIEVENFNRKVITEPFNKVVCEYLAKELDPESSGKTLVFCATDAHADLVVKLLKEAFWDAYGQVDDDAVIKITGTADKPIQLIRRFKNERNPNVAVTVDLLTTGIDVPQICNLVFLRRVNSRILFDQMLGRATRRCDDIGKETFRVLDAVGIYDALQRMTAMRPVVNDPNINFTQLAREFREVPTEEALALVRDQFVAKLQCKKRHLTESAARDFETCAGMEPDAFIASLRQMPITEVAAWFINNPDLGETSPVQAQSASQVASQVAEEKSADAPAEQSPENGFINLVKSLDWKTEGTGTLGSIAQIDVPSGYRFTGTDGTVKLMEAYGNLTSGAELGYISPLDMKWFAVFEFDDVGYVKDDEKDKLDADKILAQLKEGQEAANKELEKRGMPTLTVLGWQTPPFYNPQTNNLEWAIRLRSGDGGSVVNYKTKLLGRRGVMDVVLVCDEEDMPTIIPEYQKLLTGYSFKKEESYAAFSKGDKIAEYGLTGLIVGGGLLVAAKSGLLAKLWKPILIGLLAIGAFLKRIFVGKSRETL